MSWRRSGFSVHNRVYVPAGDSQGLEALVCYMMRSPMDPKGMISAAEGAMREARESRESRPGLTVASRKRKLPRFTA
ncbi:MAG TPA: hypothetical protein VLE22_09000 [Bryobacteraceae bacterium]|nr:hypothetical protein [Bryobacteraceae bacterium]